MSGHRKPVGTTSRRALLAAAASGAFTVASGIGVATPTALGLAETSNGFFNLNMG